MLKPLTKPLWRQQAKQQPKQQPKKQPQSTLNAFFTPFSFEKAKMGDDDNDDDNNKGRIERRREVAKATCLLKIGKLG